jgi:tetratricopeptide (TPR) repeat protein
VQKQQWITIAIAVCLVFVIYKFGKTVLPEKKRKAVAETSVVASKVSIDTILSEAKKRLSPEQVLRINALENSISRGDLREQQMNVYNQLAHFWGDTVRLFELFVWYKSEAARLENSEKSLNFAAHLLLDNLQGEENLALKQWKAFQAKDLFERSLKINPGNDSAKVGLGACYLFGNISAAPMEGITKIREVAEKDSTHVFAQITLAKGAVLSGQYDRAVSRLETAHRHQPANLEAIMLLADVYERLGDGANAIAWYEKSLELVKRPDFRAEIEARIEFLKKHPKN